MPMLLKRARRPWRNWAGSVQAQPNHYSYPVSFDEIQAEVLRASEEGQRLRVAGSGRSFSPLCWTDENLMSLQRYQGVERWSSGRDRVWVRSGTRMGDLAALLSDLGLALENWQGPAAQTLGGAVNAGALSSGLAFPCLSAQVTGLHMVCADGSARTISPDSHGNLFDAARLSLGALGVITHVELRCVPEYRLRSRNSEGRLYDLLPQLTQRLAQNRGFGFRWFPYTGVVQEQSYQLTEEPLTPRQSIGTLHGMRRAALRGAAQWALTQASRRMPEWTARAQRRELQPAASETVVGAHPSHSPVLLPYEQIEYAIPLQELGAALSQMERVIRALDFPAYLPVEVRFSRADTLWLSPAHGRNSAFIAVRAPQGMSHADYFTAMAEIAERHDGRPAWGGMHGKTAQELRPMYPKFDEFLDIRKQLDPYGVFLNPHLAQLFGVRQL